MKFDKLATGMVLYDVHSHRMGNTTMKTLGVWTVRIVSIDHERRTCMASWNGNRPVRYSESQIAKLKKDEPFLVKSVFGSYRRPTREESAAHRAQLKSDKQERTT